MAKCLITGANGFLGRHLSKRLQGQGHEVVALPRELLLWRRRLNSFVRQVRPDYVYHLAAYGNKYNQTDENDIIQVNILGTHNLLQALKHLKYNAFVNIGSSSEYGTKKKPMSESDSLDTDTYYGISKAASSLLVRAYAHKHHKPALTVRPFSLYGPEDDPRHFIPTAINSFLTGTPMQLSSGVHDWIWVEDFIDAILKLSECAPKIRGQVFNVGTGVQTSNHAIISILKNLFMLPGKITYVPSLRSYDTTESWVADTSKINALGWYPKISIDRGVEQLVYGAGRT